MTPKKLVGCARLVDKLRNASNELIDLRLITGLGELRYIPDRGPAYRRPMDQTSLSKRFAPESEWSRFPALPPKGSMMVEKGPVDEAP